MAHLSAASCQLLLRIARLAQAIAESGGGNASVTFPAFSELSFIGVSARNNCILHEMLFRWLLPRPACRSKHRKKCESVRARYRPGIVPGGSHALQTLAATRAPRPEWLCIALF